MKFSKFLNFLWDFQNLESFEIREILEIFHQVFHFLRSLESC